MPIPAKSELERAKDQEAIVKSLESIKQALRPFNHVIRDRLISAALAMLDLEFDR